MVAFFTRGVNLIEVWSSDEKRKCSPVTLVSGNIRLMGGYSRGFTGEGGVKRQWGNRKHVRSDPPLI